MTLPESLTLVMTTRSYCVGVRDSNERIVMNSANRKPVIMATTVAAMLLVIIGVGYRVLVWRLGVTDGGTPLPPGALQCLPMQLGQWSGRDVSLGQRIVVATDAVELTNRSYSRRNGAETVGAYVVYGVRVRDLIPHRPDVCYPLNGWTLEDTHDVSLPLADETKLECRILRFTKGGANMTVLHYYIVDGTHHRDVSEVRSGLWSSIDYMAQVQITCSYEGRLSPESSVEAVSAFAIDSTRAIYDLFLHSEDDLKQMWTLYYKVMAEYEADDPKGHAELIELRGTKRDATFRSEIGKKMRERKGLSEQSTTLPSPVSHSAPSSGGRNSGSQ